MPFTISKSLLVQNNCPKYVEFSPFMKEILFLTCLSIWRIATWVQGRLTITDDQMSPEFGRGLLWLLEVTNMMSLLCQFLFSGLFPKDISICCKYEVLQRFPMFMIIDLLWLAISRIHFKHNKIFFTWRCEGKYCY